MTDPLDPLPRKATARISKPAKPVPETWQDPVSPGSKLHPRARDLREAVYTAVTSADTELLGLSVINTVFERFTPPERERVLAYLQVRYGKKEEPGERGPAKPQG